MDSRLGGKFISAEYPVCFTSNPLKDVNNIEYFTLNINPFFYLFKWTGWIGFSFGRNKKPDPAGTGFL